MPDCSLAVFLKVSQERVVEFLAESVAGAAYPAPCLLSTFFKQAHCVTLFSIWLKGALKQANKKPMAARISKPHWRAWFHACGPRRDPFTHLPICSKQRRTGGFAEGSASFSRVSRLSGRKRASTTIISDLNAGETRHGRDRFSVKR